MNKKELIKEVKEIGIYGLNIFGTVVEGVPTKTAIKLIKQLDEPEKVVVPQFVADWYEEHKDNLEYNIWDWMKYNLEPKKQENVIFSQWLGKTVNKPVETLIKMKLYGYEVEKEKLFKVRLKGTGQYLCNDDTGLHFQHGFKTDFTKDYLEKRNFGWVFDCEGIEIEEVKE